jgi:hypothetical protein
LDWHYRRGEKQERRKNQRVGRGVGYWQSSSSLYTASQLRPFPVSTEARNTDSVQKEKGANKSDKERKGWKGKRTKEQM